MEAVWKYRRAVSRAMLGVLTAVVFGLGVSACGSGLERVQLDSGPVSGTQVGGIWVFKGIPYAAPPVGALRWRPPQPVQTWEEVRQCTEFGPACPQPEQTGVASLFGVGKTAEDCLYLNIWSPAENAEARLPVMVWIHGGSFETGAGSMSVYDGTALASRGVVVVTINYRLGPLGFLAHPALSAESAEGLAGNYGLLDQIAALKWVQANIAGFGGDPGNVTVFGESAGAISILDLLVSPLAEGLFQRAIAESGILLDEGFGVTTAATKEDAEQAGKEYVRRLGIEETGDVAAQMRAKTPEELLAAAKGGGASLLQTGLTWKPVADGYVLTDLPSVLWREGKRQAVPLLIGSNKDEGNIFLQGLTMSIDEYEEQMRQVLGDYADEVMALYPVTKPADISSAFSRMLTEVGFASTARMAARSMSSPGAYGVTGAAEAAPAYLYEFTRVPLHNPLGAFHAVEIPYVFGNLSQFAALGAISQVDTDLSNAIMGYWTRFAATGDPNGDSAPQWPRYEISSDLHLELGDSITTSTGLYKEACDLADRIRSGQ